MTRAELQLAIGAAAVIGEELAPRGTLRCFAGRSPDAATGGPVTRVVLLHPLPPEGPVRGRMLERMAGIRTLRHGGLVAPLATGVLHDHTWVVEALPATLTLEDRVRDGGAVSVQEAVRVLRESARALSALHRGGMTHGALDAGAVECGATVALHRLGHADGGTMTDDLHALGRLGWLALIGRPWQVGDRSPRARRDSVPTELDLIIAGLLDPDAASRTASAEVVLEQLDWFPDHRPTPLRALIDGAGRGARLPHERRAAIALAAVGVALLFFWLLAGRG